MSASAMQGGHKTLANLLHIIQVIYNFCQVQNRLEDKEKSDFVNVQVSEQELITDHTQTWIVVGCNCKNVLKSWQSACYY